MTRRTAFGPRALSWDTWACSLTLCLCISCSALLPFNSWLSPPLLSDSAPSPLWQPLGLCYLLFTNTFFFFYRLLAIAVLWLALCGRRWWWWWGEGAMVDLHVFRANWNIHVRVRERLHVYLLYGIFIRACVFLFTCRIMERSCRVCAAPVSGLMCWNFFFFFFFARWSVKPYHLIRLPKISLGTWITHELCGLSHNPSRKTNQENMPRLLARHDDTQLMHSARKYSPLGPVFSLRDYKL